MSDRKETLTPEALEERGARLILEGVKDLVRGMIEGKANDYYDQSSSPIGADRHKKLCRAGELEATKDGRRWLVKRDEMERYLRDHPHHRTRKATEREDLDEFVDSITKGKGRRR